VLPGGNAKANRERPMGKSRREDYGNRERRKKRQRVDSDGIRSMRLQELIREEVNLLLRGEIRDPRLETVEITMVELAGDGSCARLWFTMEETALGSSPNNMVEALDSAAGFLRSHLAESLCLKRTPELRFRRDPATRVFARFEERDE
jgi:ribosome-binding factor A